MLINPHIFFKKKVFFFCILNKVGLYLLLIVLVYPKQI
jgi:hypothetical protein